MKGKEIRRNQECSHPWQYNQWLSINLAPTIPWQWIGFPGKGWSFVQHTQTTAPPRPSLSTLTKELGFVSRISWAGFIPLLLEKVPAAFVWHSLGFLPAQLLGDGLTNPSNLISREKLHSDLVWVLWVSFVCFQSFPAARVYFQAWFWFGFEADLAALW